MKEMSEMLIANRNSHYISRTKRLAWLLAVTYRDSSTERPSMLHGLHVPYSGQAKDDTRQRDGHLT